MLPETELWVVPPSHHSAWFARLDWYLNWQMSKGLAHRPVRPSAEVEQLAQDYEIPIPFAQLADPGPLLIASSRLVPASSCIVLPYAGDVAGWLEQIAKFAENLRVKTVAIFLPAGVWVDSATSAWSGIQTSLEVQFIKDQEDSAK